jgi:hypothetical protein
MQSNNAKLKIMKLKIETMLNKLKKPLIILVSIYKGRKIKIKNNLKRLKL